MKKYYAIVNDEGYIITTGNMNYVELEIHRTEGQAVSRLRFHNKPGQRIVELVEKNKELTTVYCVSEYGEVITSFSNEEKAKLFIFDKLMEEECAYEMKDYMIIKMEVDQC